MAAAHQLLAGVVRPCVATEPGGTPPWCGRHARPKPRRVASTRSLPVLSPDSEYPPDRRHLEAQVTCDGCGAMFSCYTWPMRASLGAGDDTVTARVPARRTACPECGSPIADEPDPL